jgi:hypothetical protein
MASMTPSHFCCCVISLLLSTTSFGALRYVDGTNGNDANDGNSLNTAWRTIQRSFDLAQPGDSVFIRGGTYPEHPVLHVSGLPGQPIWFGRYADEIVAIDGDPSLGNTIITIEDQSHIILHRLLIHTLIRADAQGVLVRCTPNGHVSDITLELVRVVGISWTDNASDIPTPEDNAQPIIVYGEGATADRAITGLTLRQCVVEGCSTGYSEAISLDGNITGALLQYCSVTDNTNIGYHMAGGYGVCADPLLDNVRNSTIRDCFATWNISPYATSAGIYIDGADSILVYQCVVSRNGYGIEVGCEEDGESTGVRVIDNQVYSNLGAGLAIGGYDPGTTGQVLGALVRNNDFFNNDSLREGTGEVYLTKASQCVFRNNIFYTNDQGVLMGREEIPPQANNSFDFDLWFARDVAAEDVATEWGGNTLTGIDAFLIASGWETNGQFGDPQWVSDSPNMINWNLQPGSPCIDTGDPGTLLIPEEDPGRLQGPFIDIGSVEYPQPTALPNIDPMAPRLFPNPCGDVLTIRGRAGTSTVDFLDATGRLVKSFASIGNATLALGDLPGGAYIVRIVSPGSPASHQRLVKR